MRLLLLDDNFKGENQFVLRGKSFRYLTKVLRLGVNQKITARDKVGNFWLCTLKELNQDNCVLLAEKTDKVVETTDTLPKLSKALPKLYLFQAITKQKKFEQITRQATEIGSSAIIPINSQFSTKINLREDRLEAMVTEAIQQSGSSLPTKLEPPINLFDLPNYWNNRGPLVFFHQNPLQNQKTLEAVLLSKDNKEIGILIGAEGGFSEEECIFLRNNNFNQIFLQSNILRAETAAIYALSICQFILTK